MNSLARTRIFLPTTTQTSTVAQVLPVKFELHETDMTSALKTAQIVIRVNKEELVQALRVIVLY